MTLRKYGSRSYADLKSDPNLKTFIRRELKDLINDSVQDYLQKNKIPIATIAINMDKDCNYYHHNPPEESNRNILLNISTSPVNPTPESKKKDQGSKVITVEDDNSHWMTWRTHQDRSLPTKSRDFKNYRCQTPASAHRYRCPSPFTRPNTATGHGNSSSDCGDAGFRFRPCSIESAEKLRFEHVDRANGASRHMASIAVGPDHHFVDTATNTQKSYQISDYLKKNMNLSDPYERNVYSSLMEVMRKKNQQTCGLESESGDADPVIQISEYKHRFQNPRTKVAFPTSNTQTLVTVKKPPICPHKARPLGSLRSQSASISKFRFGEQFLF